MRRLIVFAAAVLTAWIGAACHSGDGVTGILGTPTGIHIVAGAGYTDTIGATPAQALIVQVGTPDRRPLAGAVVRFESVPCAEPGSGKACAFVGSLASQQLGTFAVDSTDAAGRASVRVVLGFVAGDARIVVAVPELGVWDTARYTVRTGNAATLQMTVRDTVVRRGARYVIGARVTDRAGNPRSADAVSYSARSAAVAVDATGTVTAVDPGRGIVIVSAGQASDTAFTSVVPPGTIAIWGRFSTLGLINTDGTDFRALTPSHDASIFPQWSPDGRAVVFYEGDPGFGSDLSTVDMNGARAQLVTTPGNGLSAASFPRYAPDGAWVYFTGVTSGRTSIWRVRPAGTGLSELAGTGSAALLSAPSVSPDGSTLIYGDASGTLARVDIATGTGARLPQSGSMPVYSPDGSKIAYLGAGGSSVLVMQADATNAHPVSPAGRSYQALGGVSWSPDGQWLLAVRNTGFLEILRPSDGIALPLKMTAVQAAWGPQ